MKRSQIAVETLLMYGLALLIVMLVIGALFAFGILDLGGLLPDRCQMGDGLVCENFLVQPTQVQLELRNTFGKNIAPNTLVVTVIGEGDDEGLWGCPLTPSAYTPLFENGDLALIQMNCNVQVSSGKKIDGKITAQFQPVGSQITRTITGNIRATVS